MKFVVSHFAFVSAILLLSGIIAYPADVMYWESNFAPIALANITSQGQTQEGNATVTLNTNGNVEISANNTVSGPAELSCATDTLVTEYKLSYDGNGSGATGGANTSYETYNSFLSTPSSVTYVADDNDVQVTLYIRASNSADDVADSDMYSATQTLTVTWIGP